MMLIVPGGWTGNTVLLRNVGITEFVQHYTDISLLLLLGILTQLGDVWFLFLLASALYLWGPTNANAGISRDHGAVLLAIIFLYIGLITLLKHAWLLPRPPGAMTPPPIGDADSLLRIITASLTTVNTPGFPSGHAVGSTLAYGTLAEFTKYGTRRQRWVVAGSLVGSIGVTRIALGLHYVGDILAGIAIGLVSILIVLRISGRGTKPTPVFLLTALLGGIGSFTTLSPASVSALGAGIGGWVTWTIFRSAFHDLPKRDAVTSNELVFAGSVVIAGGIIYWVVPGLLGGFVTAFVLVSGILCTPLIQQRIAEQTR